MGLKDEGNADCKKLGLRVDDAEIRVFVGLRDVVAVGFFLDGMAVGFFLDGMAVGFFDGSGSGGVVVSMGFEME